MNDQDRGILVGMVLGDGYLNVRVKKTQGKYLYESSELAIVHSIKQRGYLEHKAELLRSIFGGTFSVRERHATLKNGITYPLCGFNKSNRYFRVLKGMMYRDGKKTITRQVLDMLTPQGIAIWYMDDGHARRNLNKEGYVSSVSTNIATCCPESEAVLVCGWFGETHGIKFTPFLEKGNFSVRCNTTESHKFARLIDSFVIPFMRYKLAHVADLNLHERQAPVGKCTTCGDVIFDKRRKGLCTSCYTQQYQ